MERKKRIGLERKLQNEYNYYGSRENRLPLINFG